jgi:formylmethanofuran dehydrogenase subunit E
VRVAVFKHAHHRVDLDRRGKDSFRYAAAGAVSVTVVARDKIATFEAPAREPTLDELTRRLGDDVDLVLAEGFHGAVTPYLLLLGPGDTRSPRDEPGELLGIIAADGDATLMDRDNPAAVARYIVDWLAARDPADAALERAMREAEAFHGHLCPGQVLGVRMALLGCRLVGIDQPKRSKQLICWVEVDRCGADAVQTVTGCRPGKRTLKLVDYGKLAATFLNTETGDAVRVSARADSRERAAQLFPELDRKDAQMAAYRRLSEAALFDVQHVRVAVPAHDLPGKPTERVVCVVCREEVSDHRHVEGDDGPMCRACAGGAYYRLAKAEDEVRARW